MPAAIDNEGLPIIYSTFEKSQSVLPSFITFDKSSLMYTMSPLRSDKAGIYTIQVDITDSLGAFSSQIFDVKVIET